ncbi:MAG: class I SAM-dependent methyltransferase [Pseudomonadota bacterium]|nr:class I SAM-dependent methyltransferase [Pseudomonadota bacterium]
MPIDPATFEFYTKRAPHYTFSFAQSHSYQLDPFLDRLDHGAAVLELGCGGGQDSARIRERGFVIDATDGVPAMVAKANERFSLDARVMRFDQLDAIAAYDAVWAHATLLHCPRTELPDALGRICRALKPEGWHFASFKLGTGEGRDLLGRLHNFPPAQWLLDRYSEAGFNVIDQRVYAGKGSDGTQRDWIDLTVQKS